MFAKNQFKTIQRQPIEKYEYDSYRELDSPVECGMRLFCTSKV